MGHFSVEVYALPGSDLSGNQQLGVRPSLIDPSLDKTIKRPTYCPTLSYLVRHMASAAFLNEVISSAGVSVDKLSAALHITKSELAIAAGLSRDAVSKAARSHSVTTQSRLREMSEIINRVIPWAGSELAAYAWYRSQPLPSFGDATAEELVRQGQGERVRAYLGRIAAGGFA